jgi:hypothetical protein
LIEEDIYEIGYHSKDIFLNDKDPSWRSNEGFDIQREYDYNNGSFSFKFSMDVAEIKNYVSLDEKVLNERLKFLVKIKPSFPYYDESDYKIGNSCEDLYDGETYVFFGRKHQAKFDILSLKLFDSSTGKIFLERNYTQIK